METSGKQSLSALVAKQPKFHFWLLSSLGVVVFATSFLTHDKRGLLYYDEPSALLAGEMAMMPDYVTGGFGGGLASGPYRVRGGEQPNRLRRTIAPRGAGTPAAGLAGSPAAPVVSAAPATPNFADTAGPALASGPVGAGSPGLPAFGTSGGFAPTPIGFVPAPTSSGGSSSGGSSSGGGSSGGSSGGTPGPVVPAVPEPASWLMMIIAVFTLGAAIRRGHATRETAATC